MPERKLPDLPVGADLAGVSSILTQFLSLFECSAEPRGCL